MTTTGGKRPQYRSWLNNKYSKNNWGFIAKEKSRDQ